jgi:hypothetical protein
MGGGRFVASGGASLDEKLNYVTFRLDINGTNITVPIPTDFITTGDAKLEISGPQNRSGNLATVISGNILAKRSVYTQDIDLAKLVGGRAVIHRSQVVVPRLSELRGSIW